MERRVAAVAAERAGRRAFPGVIRHHAGDRVFLVRQDDHAAHSGRLASQWSRPPVPFQPALRAIELHDAGWTLLDDRPHPLPDGRAPHLFDFESGLTTPAWRRSVAIARDRGPREALVVSGHFSRFDPAFATEQAPLKAAWRLGVDPEWEQAAVDILRVCDGLSLRLLCRPGELQPLRGYRYQAGTVSPWPFAADRIDDFVAARALPDRIWDSAGEFEAAYQAAPVVRLELVLRPA